MRRERKWLLAAVLLATNTAGSAVTIEDLAKPNAYDEVKISPDGRYLATSQFVSDTPVLGLVNLADMKMQGVGARDDSQIVNFEWVAPDRLMYSIGERWNGMDQPVANGELFTIKGDGSDAAMIFGYRASGQMASASTHIKQAEPDIAIGSLIAPLLQDPGFALIKSYPLNHTVNANNFGGSAYTDSFSGSFPEAYKINLRDGKKTRVLTSPLRRAYFVADHQGVIRFVIGAGDDQKQKILYRANDSAAWETVWEEGAGGHDFVPLLFDRSNKSVYVRCGTGAADAICRWDTTTRKSTTLWTAKDSSAAELVETFDGMDAFAIRTMPGRSATVLLDKSAPEAALLITLMKQFPGEDIRFTSASQDGKKAVFVAQADVDPGLFYLYDADKKKVSALFERRPGIKPEQMASMEPIEFKARDGLNLHGYLTKPRGREADKNLPTVVLVHGGPYFIRDRWRFDPEIQMLAAHGYAVLQVNFRGSGGYGEDFEAAGYREWGGKMQDDVTDATRWAIAQGVTDPKRVCIFGASYGGYAALEGAVKEPDLYQCAIGYVGVYDLRLMHSRGDTPQSSYGVSYLKKVLGEDDVDLWNRSPIAHLDALKAKLMLIVGGQDKRVPPIQGENLHNALLKRGVAHEWVYEAGEGHGFYLTSHRAQLYTKIAEFLDRQIGGKTASGGAQ
jgi:dipeptidyl aminopeptidase/acylaminoacyl peptidase